MADRAIQEYGLDRERCVVCYPFAVLPPEQAATGIALAEVLPEQVTHVVYSGALGDKQNPDGLFAFMNALGQRLPNLCCHVFSGGPHFERLKASAGVMQGCAVSFHDLVLAEQVEELYARSAIQIIQQADGTADGSLPSKLPNLLAAGVPIFAICEPNSELGYLVEKANAGVVAQSWDAPDMNAQFDELLATLALETRDQRKARQRAFVQTSFSVEAVVDAVLQASKYGHSGTKKDEV
jgi:glycosyltransferase involved in cell wall biosynthesis